MERPCRERPYITRQRLSGRRTRRGGLLQLLASSSSTMKLRRCWVDCVHGQIYGSALSVGPCSSDSAMQVCMSPNSGIACSQQVLLIVELLWAEGSSPSDECE